MQVENRNQAYLNYYTGISMNPVLLSEFTSIGTASDNTIIVNDIGVEGRHARIEKRGTSFFLKDMRTSTGTFLNNQRILEALIGDGDQIEVGKSKFVFSQNNPIYFDETMNCSSNSHWATELDRMPSISQSEFPVLILGSSGTGKEGIAQRVHNLSHRRNNPFISVNCSAMSESLIESELFGHIKGSFTGATHDRLGAFESAKSGTLFLDEIGDFPLHLQPKLLRALENAEIRPVGSDQTIKTNVRIIAATHQDLALKVAEGKFRADLFYRLHVIKIKVPSLRERYEDFEKLLFRFAREQRVRFNTDSIEELKKHSWPGNIRELKNTVLRASALFPKKAIDAQDVIHLIDSIPFPDSPSKPEQSYGANRSVIKEIEKDLIIKRLIANKGNQRRTAGDLGMPKSTLHDRIKTYAINLNDLQKLYR